MSGPAPVAEHLLPTSTPAFLLTTPTVTWLGLAGVLAAFVTVRAACSAAGLPKPGQFATVASAFVAAALASLAGVGCTELGLAAPTDPGRTLGLGVALAAAVMLAAAGIGYPLARLLKLPPIRPDAFGALRGDGRKLIVMLVMVWTTVAIGEEFVFRGFLQQGLAGALSTATSSPTAVAVLAVALQAVAFGVLHFNLGAAAVLNATLAGLVLGAGLLATGGNLWPLVIAHGLVDTVGMIALYRGAIPR